MEQDDKERLIRLEERVLTLFNEVKKINDKLDKLSESQRQSEITTKTNSVTIGAGERVFWLITSGVIGFLVWLIKQSGGA